MPKPVVRRAPGRSAAEVRAAIERFLQASRKPALLEPGEAMLSLDRDNFALDARAGRLTLQAWDERRNLTRRIVDVREESRGRLELVAERFARKLGPLFLIDLDRPATQGWERRGVRFVFRERFGQILQREFPAWQLDRLTTEADLEHSLSPAYARALLKRGAAGLAAIGAPPGAVDSSGVLSFGLIWLDYLRRTEPRLTVEGLVLCLPAGEERTTCLRLRCMNPRAARFEAIAYSETDQAARLDLRDVGNLDTQLDACHAPPHVHDETLARLTAIEGVERIDLHDGEISLRVRGLEFARTERSRILSGLAGRSRSRSAADLERLAEELARKRAPSGERRGELYLRDPEAWLESQVRANMTAIDAALLPNPVYGQVPAFAAGERGVLDLLAVGHDGRLTVLELKASADIHLPLQALDYWMRVKWHLDRGEFAGRGYFPGVAVRLEAPRVLLIAPALEFHPSTESILRYFSPEIEIERIGVGSHWRRQIEVMFRLSGAARPE